MDSTEDSMTAEQLANRRRIDRAEDKNSMSRKLLSYKDQITPEIRAKMKAEVNDAIIEAFQQKRGQHEQ